jgi:hypothetical protein
MFLNKVNICNRKLLIPVLQLHRFKNCVCQNTSEQVKGFQTFLVEPPCMFLYCVKQKSTSACPPPSTTIYIEIKVGQAPA